MERWKNDFGDDYFAFKCRGVLNVVLNSQLISDPSAMLAAHEQQAQWFEATLERAERERVRHVMVFAHHPFFLGVCCGGQWTSSGFDNLFFSCLSSSRRRARRGRRVWRDALHRRRLWSRTIAQQQLLSLAARAARAIPANDETSCVWRSCCRKHTLIYNSNLLRVKYIIKIARRQAHLLGSLSSQRARTLRQVQRDADYNDGCRTTVGKRSKRLSNCRVT